MIKACAVKRSLLGLIPAIAILLAMAGVSVVYQVSIPSMTRDVAAIAGVHPLSGALSSLGILVWCTAAATCTFAAMLIRPVVSKEECQFLLCSALLTTYLMLDDLFQFHEALAGRYLGLNEKVVYLLLGVAVFSYLASFREIILQTNFLVFALALAFLALSVVTDTILEPWLWRLDHWALFIEDGAKWLGIVCWCSYYVETSFRFAARGACLPENAMRH